MSKIKAEKGILSRTNIHISMYIIRIFTKTRQYKLNNYLKLKTFKVELNKQLKTENY
jgi:hypothetical protein